MRSPSSGICGQKRRVKFVLYGIMQRRRVRFVLYGITSVGYLHTEKTCDICTVWDHLRRVSLGREDVIIVSYVFSKNRRKASQTTKTIRSVALDRVTVETTHMGNTKVPSSVEWLWGISTRRCVYSHVVE